MVSLRSFRIQVRKGRAYPTYLTLSAEAEFQRAVDYYEERIGRPASALQRIAIFSGLASFPGRNL